MTMKKGLLIMFLAALVAVAPTWAVQADFCYRQPVYYNYPQVVKKVEVVEKQVLVASLVPVVVGVPVYPVTNVAAGYAQAQYTQAQQVAQGYPAQPQGMPFDVNALNSVLTAINQRLTTIETSIQGGVSTSGAQAQVANNFPLILAARCAGCHGETPKGNQFSMFDSNKNFKQPDVSYIAEIQNRIFRNSDKDPEAMPPKGHQQLTDQELALGGAWVKAMLKASRQKAAGAPEQK